MKPQLLQEFEQNFKKGEVPVRDGSVELPLVAVSAGVNMIRNRHKWKPGKYWRRETAG